MMRGAATCHPCLVDGDLRTRAAKSLGVRQHCEFPVRLDLLVRYFSMSEEVLVKELLDSRVLLIAGASAVSHVTVVVRNLAAVGNNERAGAAISDGNIVR